MTDMSTDLSNWLMDRPRWLQQAASTLCLKSEIAEEDLQQLLEGCKGEVETASSGANTEDIEPLTLDFLSQPSVGQSLFLCSISEVLGINSLSPRKPLEFEASPSLTVVYGPNGSGKSGYTRILKHACGANTRRPLLSNIFTERPARQSVQIAYRLDANDNQVEWSPTQGTIPQLLPVSIFDSESSLIYVSEERQVSYEPPLLTFLTSLIEICGKVGTMLRSERDALPSRKPLMNAEISDTESGSWYAALTPSTTETDIAEDCTWTELDEQELAKVGETLSSTNLQERIDLLRAAVSMAHELYSAILGCASSLSGESCENYFQLKLQAESARRSAQEDADRVFSRAPLTGVATETWRALWEAAREYSEREAYTGLEFPNVREESKCVLCHQLLDDQTKQRLTSFEGFIRGSLEARAIEAEKAVERFLLTLPPLPSLETIRTQCTAAQIPEGTIPEELIEIVNQLGRRLSSLKIVGSLDDLLPSPSLTPLECISTHVQAMQEDIDNLTRALDPKRVTDLRAQKKNLEAKRWLSANADSVRDEVTRLKQIEILDAALNLTDTTQLSRKKASLAEELISDAYIGRFRKELTSLRADKIRVELVRTRTEKGKVLHGMNPLDAKEKSKVSEILSEGEYRIVALAAFLADMEGRGAGTPFVFDDPISSLDQDYEEATVHRLVELARTRQVIVFTHRLSLLTLLADEYERNGSKPKIVCVRTEPWGSGESGGVPINCRRPASAANDLINDRLAKAAKVYGEIGTTAYEELARSICSDTRILIERMIEEVLLGDVVQRFRRAVHSQKIGSLAKIRSEDISFIDQLMTKYSRYEHSQPQESHVPCPLPNEIQSDLQSMVDWCKDFSGRPTA